jgi:hypothetical protein
VAERRGGTVVPHLHLKGAAAFHTAGGARLPQDNLRTVGVPSVAAVYLGGRARRAMSLPGSSVPSAIAAHVAAGVPPGLVLPVGHPHHRPLYRRYGTGRPAQVYREMQLHMLRVAHRHGRAAAARTDVRPRSAPPARTVTYDASPPSPQDAAAPSGDDLNLQCLPSPMRSRADPAFPALLAAYYQHYVLDLLFADDGQAVPGLAGAITDVAAQRSRASLGALAAAVDARAGGGGGSSRLERPFFGSDYQLHAGAPSAQGGGGVWAAAPLGPHASTGRPYVLSQAR